MGLKRFASIPILSVLILVGFVYYVTVFVFIEGWVGLRSSSGSFNALIFTFIASLFLFSFSVCVLTDPGHVSPSFLPDLELLDSHTSLSKRKKLCDKCSTYKPPRAHHCRVCRRCVLRMDHHCMWINNCVGYRNYKAFFALVFYGTVASIYSTVMIITYALGKEWEVDGINPLKIFCVIYGVVMVSLSLILGTLLGWHVYLIIHNMTTIEHYEAVRATWMAKKSGQNYRHPFDLTAYKNITLILGPNMLKWLCPNSIVHLKDGLSFPVFRDDS